MFLALAESSINNALAGDFEDLYNLVIYNSIKNTSNVVLKY